MVLLLFFVLSSFYQHLICVVLLTFGLLSALLRCDAVRLLAAAFYSCKGDSDRIYQIIVVSVLRTGVTYIIVTILLNL